MSTVGKNSSDPSMNAGAGNNQSQEYQFRIVLVSPSVVLASNQLNLGKGTKSIKPVTLRFSHLDFHSCNIPSMGTISKSLFYHNLELSVTSNNVSKIGYNNEYSILQPLSFGGGTSFRQLKGSNGTKIGSECSHWLTSDFLSARVAFSDMLLAVDLFYLMSSDMRKVQTEFVKQIDSSVKINVKESVDIAFNGLDLIIVDDSGKHFAHTQELVGLSLGHVQLNRSGKMHDGFPISTTRLQLSKLELRDCLQSSCSPFKVVATSHQDAHNVKREVDTDEMNSERGIRWSGENFLETKMSWDNYAMVELDNFGYNLSHSMCQSREVAMNRDLLCNYDLIDIEISSHPDSTTKYTIKVGAFIIQWNPSLVIAVQKFWTSLRKVIPKNRTLKELSLSKRSHKEHLSTQSQAQARTKKAVSNLIHNVEDGNAHLPIAVTIAIDSLTICLNKEHQHRRLIQITVSRNLITFQRNNEEQLNVDGHVGDLIAWDSDNIDEYVSTCHTNRLVLSVLHSSCSKSKITANQCHFLLFKYFKQDKNNSQDCTNTVILDQTKCYINSVPEWVSLLLGKHNTSAMNDCLSVSISTLKCNYIRSRSAEIIDYLSNGIPGKGMGATSKAAKGFIHKRIQSRSFLDVSIDAPQLIIPQDIDSDESIFICLGDIILEVGLIQQW